MKTLKLGKNYWEYFHMEDKFSLVIVIFTQVQFLIPSLLKNVVQFVL